MKKKIVFISNEFKIPENWETENGIVKTIFTNSLSKDEILSEIKDYAVSDYMFVIYVHITTINKRHSDNYGFDVAREIRVKLKSKVPLILYSSIEKEKFEKQSKSEIKYKILFGRGTGFLLLRDKKFKKDELKTVVDELKQYPITDAVLADMNEMLLDQKGVVIDKLTHDLKFAKVSNNAKKLEEILNDAAAYLTNSQLNSLNWDSFSTRLLEHICHEQEFSKIADELIKKCERELISDTKPPNVDPGKKHKILVIEDDPDFQKKIENNLKEYFDELIIKGDAQQAIQLLDADEANAITGLISDWRLYADFAKKTYWQLQGYEVLDYAAKNHFTALFALTSLSDYNVHNIRNALGLDIHLFKKQHLEIQGSKVQWEMMADVIKQKCDVIVELIGSNQSMGDGWTKSEERNKKNEITTSFKSLRQQYLEKRCNQWEIFEKGINEHSDRIWEYYKKALSPNNERSLEEISKKWGIKFEKSGIPILENVLIVRRIWLALWYNNTKLDFNINRQELPEEKVYCILRQQYYDELVNQEHSNAPKPRTTKKVNGTETEKSVEEDIESKLIQNSKNLLNKLCIIPSSLPNGILPEEKSWLNSHGIIINHGNNVIDYQLNDDEAFSEDFDPSSIEGRRKIDKIDTIEDNEGLELEEEED